MHLNKVEIILGMYQFHTLVVLFFTIVVTDPSPLGWGHSLPHLGSLTSHLLAQLISLLLRPFGYAKLEEDVLPLVELRGIFFHIRCSLGCASAKTDPASDSSALRPDASDASPASHASCAS